MVPVQASWACEKAATSISLQLLAFKMLMHSERSDYLEADALQAYPGDHTGLFCELHGNRHINLVSQNSCEERSE